MVRRHKNSEYLLFPPPQQFPWLVFPLGSEQTFYDIIHQKRIKRSVPWLRRSMCRATAFGWLLLQDIFSQKLFWFHPTTLQRFSVPRTETKIDTKFICRFTSPPDGANCYLVAIHKNEGFFVYCHSRGTEWFKYELDIGRYKYVPDAVLYNGKIYAAANHKLVVIDIIVSSPHVSYLQAKLINGHGGRCEVESSLVESCGDLYLVDRYFYDCDASSLCHTVFVGKMSFSSQRWKVAKSINNCVFTLGEHYSMSFSGTNVGVKGNFIHFSGVNGIVYSYDLHSRSLTAYFPCRDLDDYFEPYWLLLDQPMIRQEIEEDQSEGGRPHPKEIQYFDYPKSLSVYSIRDYWHLRQGVAPLTWCPRTPWLMFTDGYDGVFKFLDPCSNDVYELHIPELFDTQICSSRYGWLIVIQKAIFFFNPFTKKRVDLPFGFKFIIKGIAFSSTPTSADCVVFCIDGCDDDEVSIQLFRFRDKKWSSNKTYSNNHPFRPSHNCPIYQNKAFYCLGLDGKLGVFDPIADTWNVIDTLLSFDVFVGKCFLVDSNGDLLSIFIDIYESLIGVFLMDLSRGRWKKITHLGGQTLFAGMEASFSVAAVEQRMANKIYLPQFHGEHSHDLVFHHVGVNASICEPRKTTKFMTIWIEPKAVTFGLNQLTGKRMLPQICDQANQ